MASDDEVARLREELATLRGEHNRFVLLLCFIALLGALYKASDHFFPGNGIVTAKSLHVIDDAGTLRASLGTSPLGDSSMMLYDPAGNVRLRVKAGAEHGTIEILDAEQHTLARLSALDNLAGLHLAHGSRTAQITASSETTAVTLVDLDESASAVLRADPAGTDLQLSRNKIDQPPRLATLTAGPADPSKGTALILAGPKQFLQATVSPGDGEPRVVIAGDTRIESRTGPSEEPWQRFDRPDEEHGAPLEEVPETP